MNINKENIDQWMFQNVEGELTPEQAEQLSSFIITNSDFEKDFEEWNDAHLKNIQIEEFKNLDSILKKKSFYWKNKYTFFLGLLIGIFSWMPFAFKNENVGLMTKDVKLKDFEKIDVRVLEKEEVEIVEKLEDRIENIDYKDKTSDNEYHETSIVDIEPIFSNEKYQNIEKINLREIEMKSLQSKRKLNRHKVYIAPEKTKKELRMEKRRKKSLEDKANIKYIKGNGPGVIPMNDIGF